MRNLLITLFALVSFSCSTEQSQVAVPDHVDIHTLTIKKTSTGASIPVLASPQVVSSAFGAPSSSVQYYGELDDITYTKSSYSGLTILFDHAKTAYFDFATTEFGLVVNNQVIRPGNNISTLSSLFPGSYAVRTDGRVFIQLKAHGVMTDAGIVIVFNSDNKITRILLVQ
ncbi:MAG TPA: hypothetical protein VGD92_09335 [Sphingobacteriaceae bacterium]